MRVHTWITRFEAEGQAVLTDDGTRPHRSPTRTLPDSESRVLARRGSLRQGRDMIAVDLGPAPRTVSRILARHDVPHLRTLDPMTGDVIRASKITALRYERDRPGELVHMNVKKHGPITDGGVWRATGRGLGDNRDRRHHTGYDYIHSLADDHFRLAYSEIHADEKGATCPAFLERAIAYFTVRGFARIERLMTDNAWAYRDSLRGLYASHGIAQKFIRPHCPWQNGKVERLNRTLATEWAYREIFTSKNERTAALTPWIECYNTRGLTKPSAASHPSPDCKRSHDRVQLATLRV